MKKKKIISQDPLQQGYTYELSAGTGKEFPEIFQPQVTPQEMLEAGIMGGVYFLHGAEKEFPKSWFANAKISPDGKQHKELNFFNVKASQPRVEWERKGWIYKDDPRGWIQWYFRYYLGRRIQEEDERQIKRWFNFRRHASQVMTSCNIGDYGCHTRQRQALLHWAYDSRRM